MNCLNEKILSLYLDERLSTPQRQDIEAHISECNRCLDLLVVAYEAQVKPRKCPPLLQKKIKERLGLRGRRKSPEAKWLFGAIIFFALSFIFKRYFLQFLIAAAILGFKWAMEGEGARHAIMIFKGIKPEEKKFERKSPPPVSDITGGDRYGENQ